ncbi:MAG: response regulator [Candidatus Delongbacteria bacterium]|nr:response regulator [Candidatus Delongbacteria bacterium]MBN2833408.1 response regulator [Candidatus Delongbacteria bacterium]
MSIKILYIEDDVVTLKYMSAILFQSGFEVYGFTNGREGLTKIKDIKPDVVFVDLNLPDISGTEIITEINSQYRILPIIVVSGTDDKKDIISSLKAGAWDYLAKPVDDRELIILSINRVLEKAELMKETEQYKSELEIRVHALMKDVMDKEERYRSFLNQVDEVFVKIDLSDFRIIEVSRGAENFYGIKKDKFIGMNFYIFTDENCINSLKENVELIPLSQHRKFESNLTMPVSLEVKYFYHDERKTARVKVINLTDKLVSEERIEAMESLVKSILSFIDYPVVVYNRQFKIKYRNSLMDCIINKHTQFLNRFFKDNDIKNREIFLSKSIWDKPYRIVNMDGTHSDLIYNSNCECIIEIMNKD